MDKDVDLIVDVEPGPAQLLIVLTETLFQNWCTERNEKQERNAALKAFAEKKEVRAKMHTSGPLRSLTLFAFACPQSVMTCVIDSLGRTETESSISVN